MGKKSSKSTSKPAKPARLTRKSVCKPVTGCKWCDLVIDNRHKLRDDEVIIPSPDSLHRSGLCEAHFKLMCDLIVTSSLARSGHIDKEEFAQAMLRIGREGIAVTEEK